MAHIFGSIWDRLNRNALNDLSENVESQGKTIQNLVAKGQLTPSQYSQLLKEINGLISKGEVKPDDLSPELLELINNSDGTPFEILSIPRDNSVSPSKTTFATTRNLFNGEYLSPMALAGNNLNFNTTLSGSFGFVVPISQGQTYTISKSDDTNRYGIATFSSQPEHGDSPNRIINYVGDTNRSSTTFTAGSNDNYVAVYASVDKEPEWIQVEEGSIATEPNKIRLLGLEDKSIDKGVIDFSESKITPEDTSFIRRGGVNLFDGNYITSLGLLGSNMIYSTSDAATTSAVVAIEGGQTYTVSKSDDTNRFGIATFSNQPKNGDSPNRIINYFENTWENSVTFTSDNDETHLVVYVSYDPGNAEPDYLMVEQGSVANNPNTLFIDGLAVGGGSSLTSNDFVIVDDGSHYKNNTEFIPRQEALGLDKVYERYDNMMNNDTSYIQRETLVTESTGRPIHIYKFRAGKPQRGGGNFRNPKILFISGIHGQEFFAINEGIRFFEDLVYNWRDDEALSMLRWNVDFDIIPALNPYGVDHQIRQNANGVDLNRNFAPNWEDADNDPNSYYYGGPSPVSEIESQALDNYLQNNRESLIFAIDAHKYSTIDTNDHATWIGSDDKNVNKVMTGLLKYTNAELKRDFPFVGQNNHSYTMIAEDAMPGSLSSHFSYRAVPGVILETVWSIGGGDDIPNKEVPGQLFSVNLIGNMILTAIRNREELKLR